MSYQDKTEDVTDYETSCYPAVSISNPIVKNLTQNVINYC